VVSEDPLLRDIAKRTISFADHVMRYVGSTCGIEPKRFLDAAVEYTKSWADIGHTRSVVGLVECCLSIDEIATTEDQKRVVAGRHIEGVRAEVATMAGSMGKSFVGTALADCQLSVPVVTDDISTRGALDDKNDYRMNNLHFGMSFCCLKKYQAVLSQSKDIDHLVLAAKAASTMHDVGHRVSSTDRELNKPVVGPLLDNLETLAASDDFQNICKCAEGLEFLLSVDGRALDVLAAIKTRCAQSGELNRLIEALDASASRPTRVMEFLRF
jgi:hypothetical protein